MGISALDLSIMKVYISMAIIRGFDAEVSLDVMMFKLIHDSRVTSIKFQDILLALNAMFIHEHLDDDYKCKICGQIIRGDVDSTREHVFLFHNNVVLKLIKDNLGFIP